MPHVHTVVQGECLHSIAAAYRISRWETIYNASENKVFKKARPDPNVICPGDKLVIPDREEHNKAVPCTTKRTHEFKVTLPVVLFRVCVKDEESKPIAGKQFRIVTETDELEGTTDPEGIVEHRIPAQTQRARLYVFFSEEAERGEHLMWEVGVGSLDPCDSPEGARARLNNLGFGCGDDLADHAGLATAVRTFQKMAKLDVSGQLDDATLAKLKDAHGKI